MRRFAILLIFFWILLVHVASGQVSVTANGSASGGTMVSGDTLNWEISCPPGSTVTNILAVDADSNGIFDPVTDRSIFEFTQTDGQTGTDGPGDDDGTVNGVISTTFVAGFAPAHWLFISSLDAASDTVSLRVFPLASPDAYVNGTVYGPGGADISNILIEAAPVSGGGMYFWHGLTDTAGQYSIALGDNPTAQNPWYVAVGIEGSGLKGLVENPQHDTTVTVGPTPAIVDFYFVYGTILTGVVRDDGDNPVADAYPHTHDPQNPTGEQNWYAQTNAQGVYYLAVPAGSYLLHFTKDGYKDQWYDGQPNSSTATTIVVTNQDTIPNLDGTLIKAGLISGTVMSSGIGVDAAVSLHLAGGSEVQSTNTRDGGFYAFTVDPGSYFVKFDYNGDVRWYNNSATYPPPDTLIITGTETIDGIDIDFSVGPTSVEKRSVQPGTFELQQNYPNPFNPSTDIRYQIPDARRVRLTVYDLLGHEVAVLVDEEQSAGLHNVTWDAGGMASGMYFYKLEAKGSDGVGFVQTRKMVLIR